jgi:hypothetical protein
MFKQAAGGGAWDAEGGYWNTFLWPANVAWYGTIKEFSGVPGASLPVFFFVTVGLLYRAVTSRKTAAPPKLAKNALLTFLVTVLALAALGMAQGGQIEWTFRPARPSISSSSRSSRSSSCMRCACRRTSPPWGRPSS